MGGMTISYGDQDFDSIEEFMKVYKSDCIKAVAKVESASPLVKEVFALREELASEKRKVEDLEELRHIETYNLAKPIEETKNVKTK